MGCAVKPTAPEYRAMRTDPVSTPDPAMPQVFEGIAILCVGGICTAAGFPAVGLTAAVLATVPATQVAKIDGLTRAALFGWIADRLTPWWRNR